MVTMFGFLPFDLFLTAPLSCHWYIPLFYRRQWRCSLRKRHQTHLPRLASYDSVFFYLLRYWLGYKRRNTNVKRPTSKISSGEPVKGERERRKKKIKSAVAAHAPGQPARMIDGVIDLIRYD